MGLHKKLMRDAVTHKLMRDAETHKLMRFNPVGSDCQYCDPGQTPKLIRITFYNLVNNDGYDCKDGGGGPNDFYWCAGDELSDYINTKKWTLPQACRPCVWQRTFDIGCIVRTQVGPEPCEIPVTHFGSHKIRITVIKTSDTEVSILGELSTYNFAAVGCPPDAFSWFDFFTYSGAPGDLANCIDFSANNEDLATGCEPTNGSVHVEEVA